MADEDQRIADIQLEYLNFLDDEVSGLALVAWNLFVNTDEPMVPRRKTKERTRLMCGR